MFFKNLFAALAYSARDLPDLLLAAAAVLLVVPDGNPAHGGGEE